MMSIILLILPSFIRIGRGYYDDDDDDYLREFECRNECRNAGCRFYRLD